MNKIDILSETPGHVPVKVKQPTMHPGIILVPGYATSDRNMYITADIMSFRAFRKVKYGITHVPSGYGFFVGIFEDARNALFVLEKFFADIDWSEGDPDRISNDNRIIKRYRMAKKFIANNIWNEREGHYGN